MRKLFSSRNLVDVIRVVLSLVILVLLALAMEQKHVSATVSTLVGAAFAFVAFSVIWSNRTAEWAARIQNVPIWGTVVIVLVFLSGVIPLFAGLGVAFVDSLKNLHVEPWVWLTTVGGFVGLVIIASLMAAKRYQNNRSRTRGGWTAAPAASQPASNTQPSTATDPFGAPFSQYNPHP